MINLYKNLLVLSLISFSIFACSSKDTKSNDVDAVSYSWSNISPSGGWVSSIKYHPSNEGEVWASGDDSSGIYKSTNGGNSWRLIDSTPANHSTYSIVFDPTDADIIYAPNHFGRGILKSTNGGSSWSVYTSGLPSTQSEEQRVFDLAILPSNNQIVLAATGSGVYRSINGGQSFSKVSSSTFDAETVTFFTSITVGSNSHIYLGSGMIPGTATLKGRVYKSTDMGVTWSEITSSAWYDVSGIEVTDNALYMAYADGTITKSTNFTTPTSFINNTASSPDIVSGYKTYLAVVEGADADSDKIYIGTGYVDGDNKWGFHVSNDGGTTLVKRNVGLDDSSIFSIDVNPFNSDEVIVGTLNNGIYKTTNQGVSWTRSTHGVYANAALGIAESPTNTNHLLFASTAGITGTSKVYESTDGGESWDEVTFFSDKNVRSLHMSNSSTIFAGTWYNGIYKTSSGSTGTWSQVSTMGAWVNRIRQDNVSSNILYASAYQPDGDSDVGVWVSTDAGDNWTKNFPAGTIDVTVHPNNEGEVLALTAGIYASTDNFETYYEIGFASAAPGQIAMSASFLPNSNSSLIVGTSSGKLFRTNNYVASGSGVSWFEITVPVTDAFITGIVAVDENTWYLSCWMADDEITLSTTTGILKTSDAGETWEYLNEGLAPSQIPYVIKKSKEANTLNVGLWGGGIFRLIK